MPFCVRLAVVLAFAVTPAVSASQTLAAHATRDTGPARAPDDAAGGPSRYLYVWSGVPMGAEPARRGPARDFLAVVDLADHIADSRSPDGSYGRVVATAPVEARQTMAHHGEQVFTPGQHFFTSGYMSGQVFRFDAANRSRPSAAAIADSVPGLRQPHSFARLPNGHVLATVQFGPVPSGRAGGPRGPGGLVEFDDRGRVVRTSSAGDSSAHGPPIRPYGLAVVPALDRAVSTSAGMDDERVADVVQVWRLSDLRLLRTIELPARPDSAHREPFEARTLGDGRTVLVNTFRCGFYRLTELGTAAPRAEFVLTLQRPGLEYQGCAVPVVVGRYWVMPISEQHRVAVLDVSRPGAPREVSSLAADPAFLPHWSAADPRSDRIVVTGSPSGEPRVLLARLDPRSGRLRWDARFRDIGASRSGLDFGRTAWPHGAAGGAIPHAAVFVPERP